jgi:hypothetical protein
MFDEEPTDPHGECAAEIKRLREALAKIAHSNAQCSTDALAMRKIAEDIIYEAPKDPKLILADLRQRYETMGRVWNFTPKTTTREIPELAIPNRIAFAEYVLLGKLLKDYA